MVRNKRNPTRRTEKDSLGNRSLPADAYYGIQTDRAVENFPISGLRAHPRFIEAYILLKKAAAAVNKKLGVLPADKARAILKACDEILSGKLSDQFVIDVFQMGAGTAFNMNCNEVLANRANEILGGKKGTYKHVHPNDHVNMGQSTNDTFPTAMRIAALFLYHDYLEKPLLELEKILLEKGKEFDPILKSARTHLQDAVPIRLGQEFRAYGLAIQKSRRRLERAVESLAEVGIGGSAAGTGLNVAKGYPDQIISELKRLTGLPLRAADDLCEAMQSQACMGEVSSALRNLALELTRIVNDLRLLASGPTTGFYEIELPAVAPGSSIMPGKVNPSMLEMVNMVSFQVIGCDLTIAFALQAGQLELNVMMPLMAFNMNFSLMILGNAIKQLNHFCIRGIKPNLERCRQYAEGSMGLATALNPFIGYAHAAEVAKESLRTGESLIHIIRKKKILSEAQIQKVFNPFKMT